MTVGYGLLAALALLGFLTADDPLGAVPGVVLGLPWSWLVGPLTRLAETSRLWLSFCLALPMLVNLGLLAVAWRWLARRDTGT